MHGVLRSIGSFGRDRNRIPFGIYGFLGGRVHGKFENCFGVIFVGAGN